MLQRYDWIQGENFMAIHVTNNIIWGLACHKNIQHLVNIIVCLYLVFDQLKQGIQPSRLGPNVDNDLGIDSLQIWGFKLEQL
jgi:hypothetical protein